MKINEIREKSGLSRAEFGRKYEIPVRTLEDWESGRREPADYVVTMLDRLVTVDKAKKEVLTAIADHMEKLLNICTNEKNWDGHIGAVEKAEQSIEDLNDAYFSIRGKKGTIKNIGTENTSEANRVKSTVEFMYDAQRKREARK
jgi:putative transcriptional regulator